MASAGSVSSTASGHPPRQIDWARASTVRFESAAISESPSNRALSETARLDSRDSVSDIVLMTRRVIRPTPEWAGSTAGVEDPVRMN